MEKGEQGKMVDLLKSTLDSKNKQLEELIKRNKILEYQLNEVEKDKTLLRPESFGASDLIAKIQQLSKQLNDEQS